MKAIAILALLLLVGGCVHPEDANETSGVALPSLAADRSQPRLALIGQVLGDYYASDIASRPTTCVAVGEGGALQGLPAADETALMTRFASLAPFARCAWGEQGWTDRETGKPALVFTIYGFSCSGDAECTGYASYTAGKATSMSYRYTMAWHDGGWQFTRDARLIADPAGH